ncbi:hypothetical protein [Candidatus Nitrospira bockiana]
MSGIPAPWEQAAASMTEQALQAAEEGRWDAVQVCYERREELLSPAPPSPAVAARLHRLDRMIFDKVKIAQVAVERILTEVAATRRNLLRLRAPSTRGTDLPHRLDRHL